MRISPLNLLSGLCLLAALLVGAALLPAAVHGDDPTPDMTAPPPIVQPLPRVAALPAEAPPPKGLHVIILWMSGGPSQIDTFDPKPNDPNGGPFQAIDTAIKGVQFSEHLPRLAKLADRLTVIRSMTHREGDHTRGGYLMRTGYVWDNQIAYPGLGCILGRELAEDKSPLPRFVAIGPRFNGIPQQDPGFLGAKYGPLNVEAPDSTFREVKPSELDLRLPPLEAFKALDKDNAEAMRKSVLEAFDLAAEKKALRESYTMTPFGQSC